MSDDSILKKVLKMIAEGVGGDEIKDEIENSEEYLDETCPLEVRIGGHWWECPVCKTVNLETDDDMLMIVDMDDFESTRTVVTCTDCSAEFDLIAEDE